MGNTIEQGLRPIEYGPHMMKNYRAERAIRFLEDPQNAKKTIPSGLLLEDEIAWLREKENNRLVCAEYIREMLQGGVIG